MSLSRRKFLEVGSIVAVSSALPMQASSTKTVESSALPIDGSLHGITSQQAEELIGSRFSVDAGLGRPLQMELVSVESQAPHVDDGATGESFILQFELVRGASVPQGTYVFEHEKVGTCSLLIVPTRKPSAGYAAVINHRRGAWV